MKSAKRFFSIILSAATLLAGMSYVAYAAEPMNAKNIVKYRMMVMKSQAAHMGAAAEIIQGKVDFKDQLLGHVKALEATTKDIVSLFPKGTDVGKTKARKEVWTKTDEFRKRAKNAEEKSAALAKVVAAGDTQKYGPSFKELADACKACHKDFRKKEKH
jgi:cytochrome c556